MALIDTVKQICDRLALLGWRDLILRLTENSLDIQQPNSDRLKAELLKDLPSIHRSLPGFEDFDPSGRRGITAGHPCRSLLYHALASPHVLRGAGGELLGGFPTVEEIEAVENFVFAVEPKTLAQLRSERGRLSIVIFAYEYRPAGQTTENAHADLVFSRTGVARVGTARPLYNPATRGFWPEDDDNPHAFRVVPSRFSVWLAASVKGSSARVMRLQPPDGNERNRNFLIPIHKLFDGAECLSGVDLKLDFRAAFFNFKLQRVLHSVGENPPNDFPFVIRDGRIAELISNSAGGSVDVVPVVHPRLVEPAIHNGSPATYTVPPDGRERFGTYTTKTTTLNDFEIHPFPAYVHARTKVEEGTIINLNDAPDINAVRAPGNYQAQLYVDFTGEGWVDVDIAQLHGNSDVITPPQAAYVLISAPDFFPSCGQREVSQWNASEKIPKPFRDGQLWGVPPEPLSEIRLPANLQLPGAPFSKDDTMTAVVGMAGAITAAAALPSMPDVKRASILPDDAAGVFAPGWDVSVDVRTEANGDAMPHLAAYGLGSPFPEDAKLCAALSTFWPAVAPDVYRTMSPHTGNSGLRGTVAPLTDDEIGQFGSLPWDGIPGPRIVEIQGKAFIEMASFLHADYVSHAVENRFSLRLTARVTTEEYERRVLTAARVHYALSGRMNVRPERTKWLFLSFRAVTSGDLELQQAQRDGGLVLSGTVYRIEVCKIEGADPTIDSPRGVRWRLLPLQSRNLFFVSPSDPRGLRRRDRDVAWAAILTE